MAALPSPGTLPSSFGLWLCALSQCCHWCTAAAKFDDAHSATGSWELEAPYVPMFRKLDAHQHQNARTEHEAAALCIMNINAQAQRPPLPSPLHCLHTHARLSVKRARKSLLHFFFSGGAKLEQEPLVLRVKERGKCAVFKGRCL